MKKVVLILIILAALLVSLPAADTEDRWVELTIPFNFSFPGMEFSGWGLEFMGYTASPHIGLGCSFVFGKNSYLTLNTGCLLFLPLVEEVAVPLTLRFGYFSDKIETRRSHYRTNEYFGFSTAAGLKVALIRPWDARINLHTMLEVRYDFFTFTEDFKFNTFLSDFREFETLQLTNAAGIGGFTEGGGSSNGGYYTYTTYY
ncbi:MAG: hypothetical protein JEY99_10000 [Spirochaetales bacterium]|nr:hypothetical protein [Spirochaetales bacterium]